MRLAEKRVALGAASAVRGAPCGGVRARSLAGKSRFSTLARLAARAAQQWRAEQRRGGRGELVEPVLAVYFVAVCDCEIENHYFIFQTRFFFFEIDLFGYLLAVFLDILLAIE